MHLAVQGDPSYACEGCSFICATQIGRVCALWAAAAHEGHSAQAGVPGFIEPSCLRPKLYACARQGGEVASMHEAPFQLRRSLELGALVQLGLCLRLTEAADEDRRLVNAKLDLDLTERTSAEQVITFATQARLIGA